MSLEIRPEEFWCRRHLEPFLPQWPRGYKLASGWLLRKALERGLIGVRATATQVALYDDGVEVGETPAAEPETVTRDAEWVREKLLERGPVCCLLGDETVKECVERALSDDVLVTQRMIVETGGRL